jgi:hypothetical protein
VVAPLVDLDGDCARGVRALLARAALIIKDPMEDGVWRHVLSAVCIVEAALLAAILLTVAIQPDLLGFAPSPRIRQLCAFGALVLVVVCGYAVVGWLRSLVTGRTGFNL